MSLEQIIESLNFTTIYWQGGATLLFMIGDVLSRCNFCNYFK